MNISGAMRGLLEGHVAVVTGAAQGNGASIARGLAAAGAAIAAADLNLQGAQAVCADIVRGGGKAIALALDVARYEQCEAVAKAVAEQLGQASVLINNAGIVKRVPLPEDGFLDSVKQQFGINVLGSIHMVKALLDQLKATRGRVINLGSIASYSATTGGIGYGSSKGAVMLMTKTLADELAPSGIRVNAIAPGMMITPMTQPTRTNPATASLYLNRIPLRNC